jgi:molybdenum cofactor cytidylyltransferase
MTEAGECARIAAVVLCAGRSSRAHPVNKLVTLVDGSPLAAHAVDAALSAPVYEVIVVTGHQASKLRDALGDRPVRYAHNPQYETGMASSIRVGLSALGSQMHGALICLADMPAVGAPTLRALLGAFEHSGRENICVPVVAGRRGNPVLWPRWAFVHLESLTGDVGGRVLLQAHAARVQTVPFEDDGVLRDLDTQQALAAHGSVNEGQRTRW